MKFQINIYKPGKVGKSIKGIKAIPKESSPSRVRTFIFVGLILLVVLGFAYLYSVQIATLKRRMRGDQKQVTMLRQLMTEVKAGESQKSGVKNLLLELQGRRVLWKGKLVELSRLVPDEIRLTHLSLETVEKTPDRKKPRQKVKETILTVRGEIQPTPGQESLDHVARLIMNLNASPVFKQDFEPLALVYTQRVKTRERESTEFELSGRLQSLATQG
jgi:Tfp pilus assembly protein PilN